MAVVALANGPVRLCAKTHIPLSGLPVGPPALTTPETVAPGGRAASTCLTTKPLVIRIGVAWPRVAALRHHCGAKLPLLPQPSVNWTRYLPGNSACMA